MAAAGAANILSYAQLFICLSRSDALPNMGNCKPFHDDSIRGGRCQRKPWPQRSAWAARMAEWFNCITTFQKDIISPQAGIFYTLHPGFPLPRDLNVETLSEARAFSKAHKPRQVLVNFDAAGGNACMLLEDKSQTKASYRANKHRLVEWRRENSASSVKNIAYNRGEMDTPHFKICPHGGVELKGESRS
ncbi:hypothetical protein CNMCM5623_004621 [Aspergillus felis]|uniref:Uncharacterized protein n=1 Tax=Aspergillus felis TaxID=1287682 RepID=A0A8H6R0K9_9EURO|nr:hypothetical protein CNMCM5623_004621 [Aspergillus felis]KAF7183000.1 hypothetical protein CNMCM7691_002744 [Aspergillus felis]